MKINFAPLAHLPFICSPSIDTFILLPLHNFFFQFFFIAAFLVRKKYKQLRTFFIPTSVTATAELLTSKRHHLSLELSQPVVCTLHQIFKKEFTMSQMSYKMLLITTFLEKFFNAFLIFSSTFHLNFYEHFFVFAIKP